LARLFCHCIDREFFMVCCNILEEIFVKAKPIFLKTKSKSDIDAFLDKNSKTHGAGRVELTIQGQDGEEYYLVKVYPNYQSNNSTIGTV
jgi:hypothetical protein